MNTGVVEGMELSSSPMTAVWNNFSDADWIGKPSREFSFSSTNVSYDFGKMVGWQFIAGRNFSKEFATDIDKIIINETAAKDIGFKNPIGEYIKFQGGAVSKQIVGVIKDVVMDSPYEPQKRAIFFLDANYDAASQIHIKIKPTVSAVEALPKIELIFKTIIPSAGFDYKFVDDEYARKFGDEQRIGKLSTFFSTLAILISCLGLFGLASFVAEQRTKELAVRKVLGATVTNLWSLLSKDFVVLVIISLLIASPVTYYFMNAWLQKYTFHTEISVWIYLATATGILSITLLTVSYQSIRAALVNPAKSLKSE
jgi:ABC-type antimicrobial peptide transport system permease subunit